MIIIFVWAAREGPMDCIENQTAVRKKCLISAGVPGVVVPAGPYTFNFEPHTINIEATPSISKNLCNLQYQILTLPYRRSALDLQY